MKRKIVLFDQDDVLADFQGELLRRWKAGHPDKRHIEVDDLVMFRPEDQYPPEYRHMVREIFCSPGFFRELPPVPGGIEALLEVSKRHDVYICTSPLYQYENCVLEKYEWVDRHLGRGWTPRIIITRDKTVVSGDCLIDDNPDIKGARTPDWEHILYDMPYNRHVKHKRRISWDSDWRSVLL
ncbi:5'-3'-deoxyribonucleotidase [Candidatus Woesearchaeota archaeon]|nr:5'-3'-deoxyribonucleotidase [Candidatus Woesearchaeota archaeon]